jgi:putative ABC transport system permease protein
MRDERDRPLLVALWVVRAASMMAPARDRARWRMEWEAELVHWRHVRRTKGLADRSKLTHRVVIAVIDALRVRFQGGFGLSGASSSVEGSTSFGTTEVPDGTFLGERRGTVVGRRGSAVMDLLQDARFALRSWRKHPFQTAAILITLALGIGANTAVFSVVNTVLNPLPYPTVDRMFEVDRRLVDVGAATGVPYTELQELRRRSRTLEHVEVLDRRAGVIRQADSTEVVQIGVVSPGLFDALGLTPAGGRHFAEADTLPGAQPVVLLGERAWRARFGGRTDVLGTVIALDGEDRAVVGVVDESLRHLREDVDFWIPMTEADAEDEHYVLAWRRPEFSADQAQAEMETIEFRDPLYGRARFRLSIPGERVGRSTRALLYSSFMAASIVLLISSVNVAHLMLARTAARRGDLAVRKALGASRARLARTILVESALLAVGGALLGGLVALWSMDALIALQPESLSIEFEETRLDGTVLGYALLVLLLAMGITSLAPVLDSWRFRPHTVMRGSSVTVAPGGGRFVRQGLLVAEVALSVTLLVGAGVLVHSLVRLHRVDPGFEPDGLLTLDLELAEESDPAQRAVAFAQVRQLVGALPGVQAATLAYPPPGSQLVFVGAVEVESTGEIHERIMASFTWAGPGYFEALQIPLLEGREFNEADATFAETSAIISRSLAARLFPGTSAVGQRFRRTVVEPGGEYVVVGVVGDAKQSDPLDRLFEQQIYAPLERARWTSAPVDRQALLEVDLMIRAAPGFGLAPAMLSEQLRPLGMEVEAGEAFTSVRDRLSGSLDRPRFNAILFGGFAAVALALALVGLYGVVSQAVDRRAREMAIRVAVGASGSDVRRLILLQGMLPVLAGIVLGLGGAVVAVRMITSLLYLVEPVDPPVFVTAPILVLGIALAAIWLPARRATRVDPAAMIRLET